MKFSKHSRLWQSAVLVLFMYTCKQQYLPPVLQSNKNYLVVEGVIINGADSTIIRLSRTSNISDTVLPQPQPGATVVVVGQDSSTYPLIDRGDGTYFSAGLNLDISKQYKLEISAGNEKYQSDFVPVKQTPPIDSVGWYQDTSGTVQVYLNTHDPSNNSRYYRWDYQETWNYESSELSEFDWINEQVVIRDSTDKIYDCWSTANSSTIQIASTAKLAQDVVSQQPITAISSYDERLTIKYSILIKQYVLTQDAYNFWQNLQTTTQQLGSLFDAQPGQITGNIHSLTNPAEVVVGYISASSLQQKRIFISRSAIRWYGAPYYSLYGCANQTIPPDSVDYYLPPTGNRAWVFIGQVSNSPDYIITPKECGDCREHGGSNIKPPFWQ